MSGFYLFCLLFLSILCSNLVYLPLQLSCGETVKMPNNQPFSWFAGTLRSK